MYYQNLKGRVLSLIDPREPPSNIVRNWIEEVPPQEVISGPLLSLPYQTLKFPWHKSLLYYTYPPWFYYPNAPFLHTHTKKVTKCRSSDRLFLRYQKLDPFLLMHSKSFSWIHLLFLGDLTFYVSITDHLLSTKYLLGNLHILHLTLIPVW